MYSTCLFCNNTLGSNESIEHFPVGRRIAFDAATGRLWAVCLKCERWSLSPLETRWEAIDEGERLFRGTKLRVSTDNIGLAQLRDGTELVRIGKPIRAEFAAWRYGDQFGRRWRKYALGSVTVAAAPAVQLLGQMANLISSTWLHTVSPAVVMTGVGGLGVGILGGALGLRRRFLEKRTFAHVRDDAGNLHAISRHWMDRAAIEAPTQTKGLVLGLAHQRPMEEWEKNSKEVAAGWKQHWDDTTIATITGDNALRALATILPHVNRGGGSKRTVNSAVDAVVAARNLDMVLQAAANKPWKSGYTRWTPHNLATIPAPMRLALEMSLHETDERRAMEGELHELEQRWKEADAIAKISDEMFLPPNIDERVRKFANKKVTDG